MKNEILNLRLQKSPVTPDEYFERQREYKERELACSLFDKIKDGQTYTIRIKRTSPYSFYRNEFPQPVPDYYETSVYIGHVNPIIMVWKPEKKLTFKQRLVALFTGEVPYRMEEE